MKSTLRRILLVLPLLPLFGRTYAQQPSFRIEITSAQTNFQSGHIHVVLTSTAKLDFTLPEVVHNSQAELNYLVTARDANGQLMPDSEYGRKVKAHSMLIISTILKTLHPGDTFAEDTFLNKLYDLTKPGTYTIQLERKDPLNGGTSIKSNQLTIHINP